MVSVVNGYTCFSSCDEAKARQGKDPNPSDNALSGDPTAAKKSAFDVQPVLVLGGALKELTAGIAPVDAATETTAPALQQPSIDILA